MGRSQYWSNNPEFFISPSPSLYIQFIDDLFKSVGKSVLEVFIEKQGQNWQGRRVPDKALMEA